MLDFIKQDKDPETGKVMRKVRSFVLREGRLTTGQRNALDKLWPTFGLERDQGPLDPQTVFGRDADRVLEIGYGMGQSLAAMAKADPEKDFIGIEVHRPGVGALLMEIEQQALTNLRSYCDDAVEILELCIPDNSLARVQLYFPDPWHKKKHHKRRIVQPAWVQRVHQKLKPGGVLHMATDWENYSEHMMEVMNAAEGFTNLAGAGQFSPRPDWRPETKFERRGERLGHGVWDLLFEKH
ncbi:tRNA (guanosine(46)-N7)-methyltransferase TrmB [Alcanivorax sp. S6407]|uniref:tRNA (guanosine(46)-N7)-methyltransferase TrmB n=1 Tax=Alcanivorax sp. S6407 TaxID=2926424 RepID=UPI001FF143AF|nr:tRNA (guanosine(46)-N7)-methyltransferase TrmB [Alcanivorax sp. S6407]MCK0154667.1 tRNA (guanosine(46)-N7)-methyltransferase TrmB [Alcanivorax sp. S6407]